LTLGTAAVVTLVCEVKASWPPWRSSPPCSAVSDGFGDLGGSWYWLRSPEQEKRIISGLYNRYCIRCHGEDGKGVWDIPDVPDFTDARWQACRSDAQLARLILEGRGAVMPAFRGAFTLEESWAMARYLRSFVPGSSPARAAEGGTDKAAEKLPEPRPVKDDSSPKSQIP